MPRSLGALTVPTLFNKYGLSKLEYERILRAVARCGDAHVDGREMSAVVSRREGYPEWKVDASLHLRAEIAERKLAAITVGVRNSLELPREIEREIWAEAG